MFPQTIGMAAAFDPQAIYKAVDIISMEDRAKYHDFQRKDDQGLTFWSPTINIERDPRWGRGQETYRKASRAGGLRFEGLAELEDQSRTYIKTHGPVSSDELPIQGSIRWHSSIHWSGNWGGSTNAARSVLEQLYSTGELVIHHKKGTRKYYDLAEKYIPAELLNAYDPLPDEFEHQNGASCGV